MKKIIRNIAIIVMIVVVFASTTNFSYASSNTIKFKDVQKGSWFYDAVNYVFNKGIIKGYSDTKFAPDDKLTRGQLVTILYRLEGEPSVSKITSTFTDIGKSEYYTNAVKWANSKGIVTGYSAKSFGPGDNITRQDLAVILHRYAKSKNKKDTTIANLKAFKDESNVASYARIAVRWSVENRILSGNPQKDGSKTIAPVSNATRAEVAIMLQRFLEGGIMLNNSSISFNSAWDMNSAVYYGDVNDKKGISYDIQLKEIYTGEEAYAFAKSETKFNIERMSEDEQWVIMKFYLKNNSNETLCPNDIFYGDSEEITDEPSVMSDAIITEKGNRMHVSNVMGLRESYHPSYLTTIEGGKSDWFIYGIRVLKSEGMPVIRIGNSRGDYYGKNYRYLTTKDIKEDSRVSKTFYSAWSLNNLNYHVLGDMTGEKMIPYQIRLEELYTGDDAENIVCANYSSQTINRRPRYDEEWVVMKIYLKNNGDEKINAYTLTWDNEIIGERFDKEDYETHFEKIDYKSEAFFTDGKKNSIMLDLDAGESGYFWVGVLVDSDLWRMNYHLKVRNGFDDVILNTTKISDI